jgi:TM2 domain-containing membrane protein YozV
MYKIIGADGREYGPVGAEQLRQWMTEGRVNAQTLIQPDGVTEWKALANYPELLTPPSPPVVPAPPPPRPPNADKKIAAGLCGIIIGGLGIHKFILGYTGEGVTMLLISLLGGLLTCGIASAVMHLIGLVEGIIYLTKSDDDFIATYLVNKKGWF